VFVGTSQHLRDTRTFETSGTAVSKTQRRIPEDMNVCPSTFLERQKKCASVAVRQTRETTETCKITTHKRNT